MNARVNDQWLHGIGLGAPAAARAAIPAPNDDLGAGAHSGAAVNLDNSDDVACPSAAGGSEGGQGARAGEPTVDDESVEPTASGAADADDDGGAADDDDNAAAPTRPRRFSPWVAGVFGGAVALATVVTAVGANVAVRPDPVTPPSPARTSLAAHPTAAKPSSVPGDSGDQPLPFIALADCPPGSTPAQSLADPDKPTPWICVRHTDGQPLSITLGPSGMERSYVITAVTIIPGDIGPAQGSATPPWSRHRVVTRLQWQFNDTASTVLTQNTGNVHGEAVLPVPRINASKITVIIQETSRPPATAVSATPTTQDGTPFTDLWGTTPANATPGPTLPVGDPQQVDPSDTTFAVGGIKIIGHRAQ